MSIRRACAGVAASALVTSALTLLVFSVWIASASAAGAPKITATVRTTSPTSRLVHIVNRDHVTYRNFIVETQGKPIIVAATLVAANKSCGAILRDIASVAPSVTIFRYRALCNRAVAPGKTLDIRLTTKGRRGTIRVYMVVKGVTVPIDM